MKKALQAKIQSTMSALERINHIAAIIIEYSGEIQIDESDLMFIGGSDGPIIALFHKPRAMPEIGAVFGTDGWTKKRDGSSWTYSKSLGFRVTLQIKYVPDEPTVYPANEVPVDPSAFGPEVTAEA